MRCICLVSRFKITLHYIYFMKQANARGMPTASTVQCILNVSSLVLLYGCESWKMTENVKRKLNGAASKMLATITRRTIQEEARNPTINVVMKRGTEDGAGWDTSYACQSTA